MMTGGLILMAVMMGTMFLLGGHKLGSRHQEPALPAVAVSSTAPVSTVPVQNFGQPAK